MFDPIRTQVLRLLRVPHDPTPPAGAPGSERVFRAGRNFYKLRLVGWGLGQLGAMAGIIFSIVMLDRMEVSVNSHRAAANPAPAPVAEAAPTLDSSGPVVSKTLSASPVLSKAPAKARSDRVRSKVRQVAVRWPAWVFPLLKLVEFGGILLYLVQIPITYAMARLDYELRWYIVTDRSLRIRSGLATIHESTMSFANVQQVVVSQGPIERLLRIADVRVQSAGGGGDTHEAGAGDSLHSVAFHGVDNANEIRDLILERLRRFRETGLGDPDEQHPVVAVTPASPPPSTALAAAGELLAEARALRQALV